MSFKISHDRPNCIGCTACANIAPKFWEMSDMDGQADLLDSKTLEDGHMEREITDQEFETNMDAAQSCPVNVIHLINIGSGEKLI